MSQEGVVVVDITERFPSPSVSSKFEDQRDEERQLRRQGEEQKKEEHNYFNNDVSDLVEEEEEGAHNAPEQSLL